jgi:hypothetical protein
MASEPKDDTLSVQIANQIINVANARLADGVGNDDIAAGLRHAAANFSAYALNLRQDPPDPSVVVAEFVRFFDYYLERHKAQKAPTAGLQQLIDRVKGEF